MEKTYGIDIQFDSKTIAHCTLTAKLGDEPVYEKLDLICAAVNARYEMQNSPAAGRSGGRHSGLPATGSCYLGRLRMALVSLLTYGKTLQRDHLADHENRHCTVLLWKFCMQLLLAKDLRAQGILSKRIFVHVIIAGWIDIKLTGSQPSGSR